MSAIRRLSPAAARLLLAYLSVSPGEQHEHVVLRSGITGYHTFVAARQQLRELGFLGTDPDGGEIINVLGSTEEQNDRNDRETIFSSVVSR